MSRARTAAALCILLAAVAAWTARKRLSRHRELNSTRVGARADLRYWYLDIQDDFFAKATAPDGQNLYVSQRPLSRGSSFPVVKSSDTFRVFVIGGSVAAQYESEPARIAGRTLKDVLEHILPGRRVEVVHCGMGAYDSYRESLVLKEILRYAPDLVVLMSGNNDLRADAGPPTMRLILALRLRRWLGLPEPLSAPQTPSAPPGPSGPPPAFAENLRGMVLSARRAGAVTVLCTLPRRLDTPPGGPLPAWLWQPGFIRAWSPEGASGRAAAAAFWRSFLVRHPNEDFGHYFLARALEKSGDSRGALREFAAAKRDREPWDSNPIVRETAAELKTPLCDLEAAFDGLPYALDCGLIYRDPTHWYRSMDPLVSYAIAETLLRFPISVRATFDGAWLKRQGAALAAPKRDKSEAEADYIKKLSWVVWESGRDSPRLSEQALLSFEDLRGLDPAFFAVMPGLKAACRELVASNVWTKSTAGEFERRWACGLAHAGEVYRRAQEPRRALGYFEEALRTAPDMAFWKLYEALALRQLGRKEEAASLLDSIAGLQSAFPEVRYARGGGPGPVPHAVEPLAPSLRSGGTAGLQKQAERLEAAGSLPEALDLLRPALLQEPPDAAVLLTALRIAVSAQDLKTAQDCITRARGLRLPPRQVALVADALRRLGRLPEALAVIGEGLARTPRDPKLLNDKGVLEASQGRARQAQADLETAIAADPDLGSAYLSLGSLLSGRGQSDQARRVYATALSRPAIQNDPLLRRYIQDASRSLPMEHGKPPAHRL